MTERDLGKTDYGSDWLREARRVYLAESVGKLAEIERAISGIESNPTSTVYERRLHRLLHNLIGSGASYGFPAVTDTAREMSDCLKSLREDQPSNSMGIVKELRSYLDSLHRIFNDAKP